MGERTPLAILDAKASGRMAIAESIMNLSGSDIANLSDIKLSANWMVASGVEREDQKLFETVKDVGLEFCPALGLTIPVGKDSMSMKMAWRENAKDKVAMSPMSLVISGFAPVGDVRETLTPQLKNIDDTLLLFIDVAQGQKRLGASSLAQVFSQQESKYPMSMTLKS